MFAAEVAETCTIPVTLTEPLDGFTIKQLSAATAGLPYSVTVSGTPPAKMYALLSSTCEVLGEGATPHCDCVGDEPKTVICAGVVTGIKHLSCCYSILVVHWNRETYSPA